MNLKNNLRPIKRSEFRLISGKVYYTLSRYLLWLSGNYKFAQNKKLQTLAYEYYTHRSPLIRKLKEVDMQYQYNKIINLKIAVEKINGIVIKPGETFSYWKLIGQPTSKKGYVSGMVLFCGTFGMGIGGGLCQLSNLIYWMTLHTPLTVVERYRHSFDVFPDSSRTQPFGSGATCVYPYRDLMIKNDTDDDFQLMVNVGETHLEGSWLCNNKPIYKYEVIERNHQFKSEYWGGFSRHNKLYRKQYSVSGELINEEFITENHALMMYSPFLEANLKKDK